MILYSTFRNKKVVLPINSNRPNFKTLSAENSICQVIPNLLKKAEECLASFQERKVLSPTLVREILDSLVTVFGDAAYRTSVLTSNSQLIINENSLNKFKVYDCYFDTVRIDDATSEVFVDQLLLACLNQIKDLKNSTAAISEIELGLKGIAKMLEIIVHEIPFPISGQMFLEPINTKLPEENLSEEEKAISRWKIGHTFYAFLLIFSSRELDEMADSNLPEVKLQNATTLFRASTSAMWYASIFTACMYQEVIRPSMISTKAPGGFSGHQNREYANWAKSKKAMLEWLKEKDVIEGKLKKAAFRFVDNYFQDGEQHVLLAAAMVEDKTSLLQDDASSKYGVKMTKSAVQMLRDIFEMRKIEVEFINNL